MGLLSEVIFILQPSQKKTQDSELCSCCIPVHIAKKKEYVTGIVAETISIAVVMKL